MDVDRRLVYCCDRKRNCIIVLRYPTLEIVNELGLGATRFKLRDRSVEEFGSALTDTVNMVDENVRAGAEIPVE